MESPLGRRSDLQLKRSHPSEAGVVEHKLMAAVMKDVLDGATLRDDSLTRRE